MLEELDDVLPLLRLEVEPVPELLLTVAELLRVEEELAPELLLADAELLRLEDTDAELLRLELEEDEPELLLTAAVPPPADEPERLETCVTELVDEVLPEAAEEVLLTDVRDETDAVPCVEDERELTEVLELLAIPPPVPLEPTLTYPPCPCDGPPKNGS